MTVTDIPTSLLLSDAVSLVQQARRIVVTAHVNPDADAVGSVLGLTRGLQALGKDVLAALSDPVPDYARFLRGAEAVVRSLESGPFDLYICADVAGIERVGDLYLQDPVRFQSAKILNIDHHRTNPLFGTVNYVVPDASSTSELAFHLLEALHVSIDDATATALLFGIVGDTGSFQNGATTAGALDIAGKLVALGADNQRIAYQLFECKTFPGARLWGKILSTVEMDVSRGIVFACMSQQMVQEEGADVAETEGVAEYLRGIQDAEVVMLLKEREDGEIRVSMRSRPTIDVAAIATVLGGGGHRQAAGCTLPGPFSHARDTLIDAFDRLNPR